MNNEGVNIVCFVLVHMVLLGEVTYNISIIKNQKKKLIIKFSIILKFILALGP